MTWSDAPNAPVLTGGAVVSEDEPGDFIPREVFLVDGPVTKSSPYAVVHAAPVSYGRRWQPSGRVDELRVRVWVVAGAKGITDPNPTADAAVEDTHGINRVTGALRDPVLGQGKSTGRDVDEVTNRLIEALNGGQLVQSTHAMQGSIEDPNVVIAVSGVQWLARLIELLVYDGTVARFYHAPRAFTASSAGGLVSLSWIDPPARFDTYQNVLRRGTNPGDPAPTTPTGGTGIVITGGVLGTSAIDPGHTAGQVFNYALFHVYSEVGVGDRISSAVVKGVTVA